MIVIRLRVADQDLQQPVPLPGHLQGKYDYNGEGRQQLDRRELAWRAQAGELLSARTLRRQDECESRHATHQIAVEDVVDELEEQLVQEQKSPRADFAGEDEERYGRKQLHGCESVCALNEWRKAWLTNDPGVHPCTGIEGCVGQGGQEKARVRCRMSC